MAIDEKVAFFLRHRTLIEEWAALRGQAAAALEEAFSRAVGIISQRPDAPEIIEEDADRGFPLYRISLQVPGIASDAVWAALGWTHGGLLRPSGESWPYTGVKTPGAGKGDTAYDTAKSLLRDAAASRGWTRSSASGWVWWNYLPLRTGETDLDAYALRHVEGLVDAWKALDSEIHGR
ncbi:MAG TPA: hypothetical protein VHZ33_24580 [Trebonia sp.]|jgi:hypothetical protein|nr:hypothetical protein [Trebonia sp.]